MKRIFRKENKEAKKKVVKEMGFNQSDNRSESAKVWASMLNDYRNNSPAPDFESEPLTDFNSPAPAREHLADPSLDSLGQPADQPSEHRSVEISEEYSTQISVDAPVEAGAEAPAEARAAEPVIDMPANAPDGEHSARSNNEDARDNSDAHQEAVVKQLDLIQTRLDTMNAVLRTQADGLEALTDRRWYGQLTPIAEKLAEIHDGICADLSRLEEVDGTDGSDMYSTLDFLQDSIADALQTMGVEITEIKHGDAFDSAIHRRVKFVETDNPALHRRLAPTRRMSHYYSFAKAKNPVVVAKASVGVYRHSAG